MEYIHENHTVHLIVYHIIWCPRRRRKILTGPVASRLEQIIHEVANEHDGKILQLAIQSAMCISSFGQIRLPCLQVSRD
jgi:putative transposase